jgi:aminoglycoside phosphotransferase (APT) family kinase protein
VRWSACPTTTPPKRPRTGCQSPLIELLEDLVATPPKPSGPPTAVHGDTRHANCLWENGILTAFVDWELARVADPLLDLANTLCYFPDGYLPLTTAGFDLPGWWDRRQVVQAWEAGTGRTAVDLPRWEGLAMAKLAAVLAVGADLLTRGLSTDPRFAVWQQTLPQYVELIRFRMSLPG